MQVYILLVDWPVLGDELDEPLDELEPEGLEKLQQILPVPQLYPVFPVPPFCRLQTDVVVHVAGAGHAGRVLLPPELLLDEELEPEPEPPDDELKPDAGGSLQQTPLLLQYPACTVPWPMVQIPGEFTQVAVHGAGCGGTVGAGACTTIPLQSMPRLVQSLDIKQVIPLLGLQIPRGTQLPWHIVAAC